MAPTALLHSLADAVSNTAAQHLHKRDNMGYAIPPSLIVLICMLGAGICVCLGFAVHSQFFGTSSNELKSMSPEQMDYMREVRERNMAALQGTIGRRGMKRPIVSNMS
ncbi:uncharacterized protein BDZ99DRAFT_431209 [Mytilinidion resinicola]|uniref:Uncharacterized protein n=1 Tax=Mytilinidion resinicola TaxID=574789 RepID=A0A6A6ZAD3_9PEZI|nr:uncharacterized protein BDZ99DRAFT_431209 [Mytilinidion resinicola]KAF2817254.1 hypothetical protein BDZ99DRAFT_431209 [Mytilinidion resinicola]